MKWKKVVVVTGSSSGFGRAMVEAFLRADFHVIATVRSLARIGSLDVLARAWEGCLDIRELDVTRSEDRDALVARIEALHGRLDALVNNAGYGLFGALEEMTEGQLRRQLETNFFGPALLTRALLPFLRQTKGRVVNISSVWGRLAFPLTGAYCASKFALEGLSESLHHELLPHGVGVSLVEPGAFPTSFSRNAEWAGAAPGSSYALQTENWREERERRADGGGPDIDVVADAVVKLVASKQMPLRVALGKEAVLMTIMKLLPQRIAMFVMKKVFAKIFLRPRPALPPRAQSTSA